LILEVPLPIAVMKGSDHVFEISNEPFCEMTGRRDLVGKSLLEAFPAFEGTRHMDAAFRTGTRVVVDEFPLRVDRNGRSEDAVLKLVIDPYRNSAGEVEGVLAAGLEVTAQVEARRRIEARGDVLAEQQHWLEAVLDSLPVAVVLVEAGTARIVLSNKAAIRMGSGGFRNPMSAESDDLPFYCMDATGDRVPQDQQPRVRLARGETLQGVEVECQVAAGMRSLVINSEVMEPAHGHPATSVAAFEDVTALKRTEAALNLALQDSYRFVSVVEQSSEFMGIATLEGRLTFVNSAGQRLVGADPGGIGRMTMFDYVFAEDHGILQGAVAAAIANGERTCELRFQNLRTGEPIPVWANVFAVRDRQTGNPVALATVTHDLTEQKRNLELRERIMALVSHDLRNPLNAIMMGLSVLRKDPQPSAGAIRIVSQIAASARRMEAIIDDLLDVAKARLGGGIELQPSLTNAHELAAGIVDEFRAVHPGRDIRLRVEGNGSGSWDKSRLEQVVSNLISNALQYGPDDGPVTLDSRGGETGWTLSVHNLGEPIPPELVPHLFDPFRRGSDRKRTMNGRNLGVGLFIVRAVVEAHGGSVEVTSLRGEGTRFVVRVPRLRE
jgi:PAS domain S-box-containing protein